MKKTKHFFNLEWNKNSDDSHLILFNLSYGYKETNPSTGKTRYIPMRISTEYSILKKYWRDKPIYRAKSSYSIKYGKELNVALQAIEDIAYDKLNVLTKSKGKKPSPKELKNVVLEELGRIEKATINTRIVDYIDSLVAKRTSLPSSSSHHWSLGSAKQYTNLRNYIKKYEKRKNAILTFDSINENIYWDYFKTINDIKKKETDEYFIESTIANQCKHLRAIFNSAKNDDISIDFNYSKSEFKIKPSAASYETYLTEEQLTLIMETDVRGLLKKYEHARNYIILSSFTGLRIGDVVALHEISPIKIRHSATNYDCFYTKIRKSNENTDELAVIIPILSPIQNILKSNDNQFPKFPSQPKIRAYIKDFLTYLNFNDIVKKTFHYYLFGSVDRDFTQHELFSPHDCRRSFITNLKQLGLHNDVIEPITHPKLKFKSILDTYDKSSLNDKAVKFIKELNSKDSKIFRY